MRDRKLERPPLFDDLLRVLRKMAPHLTISVRDAERQRANVRRSERARCSEIQASTDG